MANIADYVKAGDLRASPELLWELYYGNCSKVRTRIAENPATPKDLLEELAHDSCGDVRAAVANNPNTDQRTMLVLADDEDINVRLQLAHEIGLPISILEKLADDDNPYVKDAAEGTLDILYLEEQLKEISFVCEPGHIARLGKLFIDAGLIIEEDLELCLTMSQLQEIPIGQILIRQKHFSPEVVLFALKMQTLVRTGKMSLDEAVEKLQQHAEIKMLLSS